MKKAQIYSLDALNYHHLRCRFIGLYTSAAYNRSARDIPLLRHRVNRVMERAGFSSNSHDAKALMNILETFPRDELFQSTISELADITIGILHLQERQQVKAFIRRDTFGACWALRETR